MTESTTPAQCRDEDWNLARDCGLMGATPGTNAWDAALGRFADGVRAAPAPASPAALTLADAVAHIERKAEEYANQFGYGVAGTLCFDSQVKMDHYTSLTELADELHELAAQHAEDARASRPYGGDPAEPRDDSDRYEDVPSQQQGALSDETHRRYAGWMIVDYSPLDALAFNTARANMGTTNDEQDGALYRAILAYVAASRTSSPRAEAISNNDEMRSRLIDALERECDGLNIGATVAGAVIEWLNIGEYKCDTASSNTQTNGATAAAKETIGCAPTAQNAGRNSDGEEALQESVAHSANARNGEGVVLTGDKERAYNSIDRFLRNNLCDEDYAEYSAELDSLIAAPTPAPAAQADSLEAFKTWVTAVWRPDDGAEMLNREFPRFAFAAWQAAQQSATPAPAASEADKRDAERYRWLRDFGANGVNIHPPCEHVHAVIYSHPVASIPITRVATGSDLDTAIDAAIQREKERS